MLECRGTPLWCGSAAEVVSGLPLGFARYCCAKVSVYDDEHLHMLAHPEAFSFVSIQVSNSNSPSASLTLCVILPSHLSGTLSRQMDVHIVVCNASRGLVALSRTTSGHDVWTSLHCKTVLVSGGVRASVALRTVLLRKDERSRLQDVYGFLPDDNCFNKSRTHRRRMQISNECVRCSSEPATVW
ncbi:hypothetical protein BDW22DRAFT_1122105 [Trametopsis cervina]|nr:hypothetical protein BDW22DRAFT_1122105 [Trametopsis cervina]